MSSLDDEKRKIQNALQLTNDPVKNFEVYFLTGVKQLQRAKYILNKRTTCEVDTLKQEVHFLPS